MIETESQSPGPTELERQACEMRKAGGEGAALLGRNPGDTPFDTLIPGSKVKRVLMTIRSSPLSPTLHNVAPIGSAGSTPQVGAPVPPKPGIPGRSAFVIEA